MKSFNVLLLTLLIISQGKGQSKDFSLEEFIEYLQNEQPLHYLIILALKFLGDDWAIGYCKIFFPPNFCESLVHIYLPSGKGQINPGDRNVQNITNASDTFRSEIESIYNKESEEICTAVSIIVSFYDSLKQKMTEKEILQLIKKFIANIKYNSKI